jgi:hypothetical protein
MSSMTTVTFDTQKYLETLTQAGVPEMHAKAMLEAERVIQGSSDLATKADLRDLKAELKMELADVKSEVKLLKWMLGVVVAGVVTLVIKAFLHG